MGPHVQRLSLISYWNPSYDQIMKTWKAQNISDVWVCACAGIQVTFLCTSQSTWNRGDMLEYLTPPCLRPHINMQILLKWALWLEFPSFHDQNEYEGRGKLRISLRTNLRHCLLKWQHAKMCSLARFEQNSTMPAFQRLDSYYYRKTGWDLKMQPHAIHSCIRWFSVLLLFWYCDSWNPVSIYWMMRPDTPVVRLHDCHSAGWGSNPVWAFSYCYNIII